MQGELRDNDRRRCPTPWTASKTHTCCGAQCRTTVLGKDIDVDSPAHECTFTLIVSFVCAGSKSYPHSKKVLFTTGPKCQRSHRRLKQLDSVWVPVPTH